MVVQLVDPWRYRLLPFLSKQLLWFSRVTKHLVWLNVDVFDVLKASFRFAVWTFATELMLWVGSMMGTHHESWLGAGSGHGAWSVQLMVLLFAEVLCAIQVLIVLLVGSTARATSLRSHVHLLAGTTTTIWHRNIARRFQLLFVSRDHHGCLAARQFFFATSRVRPRCRTNLARVPTHQTNVFHVQGPWRCSRLCRL